MNWMTKKTTNVSVGLSLSLPLTKTASPYPIVSQICINAILKLLRVSVI
uniref:Uncharacterized protein n=1 Tax=Meloidogyne enterolobii TaxID=390850 RepID=A0A6V7V5Z7_MELEN|nr:unnamed protein product [Meloidogyne enterolobii]